MTGNLSEELARDRRAAIRGYSSSLMSNAKWRAVFSTLKDAGLRIRQIVVKFVDVDEDKPMGLPSLSSPYTFIDTVEFGPFPLVGIEWIEIPAMAIFPRTNNMPPEQYAQDIAAIRTALEATGKRLPLQGSANGLRIVGHVR